MSYTLCDSSFDIIVAGGATGFMDDKNKAVDEYLRILKPWGYLIMSQLTYHTEPPQKILNDVSTIIGTKISPMSGDDWIKLVKHNRLEFETYHAESHTLTPRDSNDILKYVEFFIQKEHIKNYSDEVKEAIRNRWEEHLNTFK